MPNPIKRTVFFVSDGTGLTVEAVTFKDTYNSDGSAQDYVSA